MSNQDIEYKGRFIRTEGACVWIIDKDGEYITACTSVEACKELMDDVIVPEGNDEEMDVQIAYNNNINNFAK